MDEALNKTSGEETIQLLYQSLLRRKADIDGLAHHMDVLDSRNGDINAIINSIINSEEYLISNNPQNILQSEYNKILPDCVHNLGDPLILWNKPSLVFLHIPKTGGTTLYCWLSQFFHPLQIYPDRHGHLKDFTEKQLLQYKFISTHLTFDQYDNLPYADKLLITILREPKKRLVSHYNFQRAHKYSSTEKLKEIYIFKVLAFPRAIVKKQTLKQILTNNLLKNQYNNIYLRWLTDAWINDESEDPIAKNPEYYLELALERLELFTAIGILEQFDKTALLFANFLDLGNLDPASIKAQNVLETSNNPMLEKMPEIELDDETHALIEKCTYYDDIIYKRAKEIFQKQCVPLNI